MYQLQFFEVRFLDTIGTYIHDIHTHTHAHIQTCRHTDRHTDIYIYMYNIITIHYIETYRHKNIQMCYICSVPFFCGEVPRRYNTESIYAHTVIVVCSGAQSNIEKHYLNRFVSLFLVHTPDKMHYRISSKARFPFGCFLGQLKEKNHIDKTGQIVGGALKSCFLVPAPSKQMNMKK